MPDDISPAPADEITSRLAAFEGQLRDELAGHASIRRRLVDDGNISSVEVMPSNPHGLRFSWMEMVDELGFQAGHNGGRWELDRSVADAVYIESLANAVISGRVVETFAPGRSHVEIMLADGSSERETGYEGCLAVLVPLPGWKRWGRKVHYEPY